MYKISYWNQCIAGNTWYLFCEKYSDIKCCTNKSILVAWTMGKVQCAWYIQTRPKCPLSIFLVKLLIFCKRFFEKVLPSSSQTRYVCTKGFGSHVPNILWLSPFSTTVLSNGYPYLRHFHLHSIRTYKANNRSNCGHNFIVDEPYLLERKTFLVRCFENKQIIQ